MRSSRLARMRFLCLPGPVPPSDAGVSVPLIRAAWGAMPILGVCLGQQSMVEALGGRTVRGDRLMHGKTSEIEHDGDGLFAGLDSPLTVMRYHSLVTPEAELPSRLTVTARCADPPYEVMAVSATDALAIGVQFHPESIGTVGGMDMLNNYLNLVSDFRKGL